MLQALSGNRVTTTTVNGCRLAVHDLISAGNTVLMLWVPRHMGITWNEKADHMVRMGLATPPTGAEPCQDAFSKGVSKII